MSDPTLRIDEIQAEVQEIADPVHILDEAGIETYESCQGGAGQCFPEPTGRFQARSRKASRRYRQCSIILA
jgi:hypothetical protein